MEKCQNRQEKDTTPWEPLDTGEDVPVTHKRLEEQKTTQPRPTGKQPPTPHGPTGRSPQASDAPLLKAGGVSSSWGSSLCHHHQGEVHWAEGEEVFLGPLLIVLKLPNSD